MVKLNSLQEVRTVIIDTDVITNWLTQETETITGKDLWTAPYKIITEIEDRKLKGIISLISSLLVTQKILSLIYKLYLFPIVKFPELTPYHTGRQALRPAYTTLS